MISGRTTLYGVIGHPVAHTLSPAMHNAALQASGIDGAYVALLVPPERLGEALRGAHALGLAGLNVTVPHKQGAAQECHRLDRTAAACRAVNTLRRTTHGWEGFNTDAPACLELLRRAGLRDGARALLLGAGGAALAGTWAFLSCRARVEVAARRASAADDLCRRLGAAFPGAPTPRPVPWADLAGRAAGADVVVNATSLGMAGHPGALPELGVGAGQVALDFVYGDTAFAVQSRARGATVITGEELLVRQGELAFTLWTGRAAPEGVMMSALRAARNTP